VSGTNRSDLDVAGSPYDLRFIRQVKGPRVRERGRSRRGAFLVFANSLRDLARIDQRIGDVGDNFVQLIVALRRKMLVKSRNSHCVVASGVPSSMPSRKNRVNENRSRTWYSALSERCHAMAVAPKGATVLDIVVKGAGNARHPLHTLSIQMISDGLEHGGLDFMSGHTDSTALPALPLCLCSKA
jgi:hypothetical protein